MSIDIEDRISHLGTGLLSMVSKYLALRFFMKVISKVLCRIETGRLEVVLPDETTFVYGKEEQPTCTGRIRINNNRFFSRVATGGEIGFGEAYMEGLWDCDDLTGLFKLLIENREVISNGNICLSAITRARNLKLHRKRANTLDGSKENIADHYDLSNDFYKTFLDKSMTYSCGIFRSHDESLEDAQKNKIRMIIEKARINSDDHVLEIGCGWGGFAVQAVKETGCRVTGITVSKAQYDYARERVKQEGLEDRVEILFKDYRTVEGSFDKIVSIEMLEAVGHEYLGCFFERCDRLLKPEGLAVIQVIAIPDRRYDRQRSDPNWIQKHIFPGGLLPSLTAICDAMTAHAKLQVDNIENIGIHYAETLKRWRQRFIDTIDIIAKMGFDNSFQRKWIYYFSLCEAQFALRVLNNLQIVLTREGNRMLSKT